MIFGNIKNTEEFSFLEEKVLKCFKYANENDLLSFSTGSHEIDGDKFFVNIVEYETTQRENRFWEAHKEYLDIHLMLKGTEGVDTNFIENMELKPYVPKDDFLPMDGEENARVVLNNGDFLVCYPHDAHRTAVAAPNPTTIKKAIFKVKI